jgi:hypothetical protein
MRLSTILFAYAAGLSLGVLAGCTAQQVATVETDASAVCATISATEAAIGPLNLVPIVSTTEAYLGDACTLEKLAVADVPWLYTFAGNLKSTVAAVKLGKVPAGS